MENKPNKRIDFLHPEELEDLARLEAEIKTLDKERRSRASERHLILQRGTMRLRKQKASAE